MMSCAPWVRGCGADGADNGGSLLQPRWKYAWGDKLLILRTSHVFKSHHLQNEEEKERDKKTGGEKKRRGEKRKREKGRKTESKKEK